MEINEEDIILRMSELTYYSYVKNSKELLSIVDSTFSGYSEDEKLKLLASTLTQLCERKSKSAAEFSNAVNGSLKIAEAFATLQVSRRVTH